MNMPSENYPNFFPTFIPPPPSSASFFTIPPPRNFFTIPPPRNFFTVLPPTKNINSVALIVLIAIVCVVSLFFGALVWWWCWNKKKHQNESNVRSNKHVVYEYERRLARCRGGLMKARYGNDEPNTDCIYGGDLDLESGPPESYSSSDDNSNFGGDNTIVCNGINGTWERIHEEWKGSRQVTAKAAKDATTSNFCVNDRMVLKVCQGEEEDTKAEEGGSAENATTIIVRDNDDTRSYNNDDEEEGMGMASEEEESVKNASFKTGPSKSSTTGKSKKGKGKGRGG